MRLRRTLLKLLQILKNAYALVEDVSGKDESDHEEAKAEIIKVMEKDDYARLLEWSGMCNHLHELKGGRCYSKIKMYNFLLLLHQSLFKGYISSQVSF